jgi:UPF0176 protein
MVMSNYVIASFYQFVALENPGAMKQSFLRAMNAANVLGTIILAKEGINACLAGKRKNIDNIYRFLKKDPRFVNLQFKETETNTLPFAKAKVKLRAEIVTMGVENIDPLKTVGTYVKPQDWNALINDPNVTLIDTRNNYEVSLGTFKGAVNPHTNNFREFPEYVEQHLADKKDRKIAMCCTGGIRCEKSTAYLKSLGFNEVYHLEGGILNYLNNVPAEESLWEGQCFVFDDRVSV